MKYTIKQIAKLAGISVRTLHYYDEINLLKPAFIKDNGYRYYEEAQLEKLQQILFFRELEFPLDQIKQIIQLPDFNSLQRLKDQKQLLELKRQRIDKLITTIDRTMTSLKGGVTMSTDQKFSAFNDPSYQKYKDEVVQRWGNTQAYQQSMQKVGKMSKDELEKVKAEGEDIADSIGILLAQGFSANSSEVQQQIDRFYHHLHNFYDLSYEMFKNLGQMYVDDPRFTAYYENRRKGLAAFMGKAMAQYADDQTK
jgi:DNA-binding transcriptional MerR regulator